MHELSLAMELVQLLEQHGRTLTRIERFTLEIGAISCVDEQALRTALDSALRGTLAERAKIIVQHTPALAQCLDCQQDYSPPDRIEPCPHCGSSRKRWLAGEAFKLRSIEGR